MSCLLIVLKMSAPLSICLLPFINFSLRCYTAVTGVLLIYLIFLMIHPVHVICFLYDQPLLLALPCSTAVSWVQSPLSSHLLATVDPLGVTEGSLKVSLFLIVLFLMHLQCIMAVFIKVLVYWCSVHPQHQSPNWPVKQVWWDWAITALLV